MENKDIIGIFSDEESLVKAMRSFRDKKVPMKEAYTPYPIHEVFHILGRKSNFTWAAFFYGLLAVILILAFVMYTSVTDWPLNFGGKPTSAFPSFIIVTIVLTILSVTILSLFTFSIRAKIYPGKVARLPDLRATDDKFILVFDKAKAGDMSTLRPALENLGASEVYEKEAV